MSGIQSVGKVGKQYAGKIPSVEDVVESGKKYFWKYTSPLTYHNPKGNAVVRQYRNARTVENVADVATLGSSLVAWQTYGEGGVLGYVVGTLFSLAALLCSKVRGGYAATKSKFRPEYKAIKSRAKSIAKAKKDNAAKNAKETKENVVSTAKDAVKNDKTKDAA